VKLAFDGASCDKDFVEPSFIDALFLFQCEWMAGAERKCDRRTFRTAFELDKDW